MSATRRPGRRPTRPPSQRRSGELGLVELLRWTWRQLTSMRTALVLLLLLALAAVPGSVVPQQGMDAMAVSQWQDQHPRLAPIYERLGLFSVYDSVWFSAIYLLLMISLVGCIVPRLFVYARALRARPPRAPRYLTRLPDHASYSTPDAPSTVLDRAARVLRDRGYRVVEAGDGDAVSAERGKLREAGNLLFHFALLIVLAGFAVGSLFGYQGGVIVLVGGGFSNNLTQYDDFDPGALFDPAEMEPFSFSIEDFEVDWVTEGRNIGMSRKYVSDIRYRTAPGEPEERYDLRVNHPLGIGGSDVFLIGHGYAPEITVRDGSGKVVSTGPTVFLPTQPDLLSFGVVKAPDAEPGQIGLEGQFYPSFILVDGDPRNITGDAMNPTLSMLVYTGDLGLDDGSPQSVYVLDKSNAEVVEQDGKPFRIDLQPGQTVRLPDGLGSVTFDGVREWNRVQISRTPLTWLALLGVCLALLGLMGSLFIRPRRAWVRAREGEGGTLVEIAVLDRSGGADLGPELTALTQALDPTEEPESSEETTKSDD